uniref:UDP-glucuronosyltransferase n=1 Tax=Strigamia maritima TaxID=126957 RepID=A0A023R9I2_STRMM|nr:UDP-glycosyltransferase 211C1 [Strigamia maritima]
MFLQAIVLLFFSHEASCSKILCLLPVGGKSHEHILIPVVEELVKANHHVTCVWPHKFPKNIDNPNFRIIAMDQIEMRETTSMQNIFNLPSASPLLFFASFTDFTIVPCETFFKSKEVQLLIKRGVQFDLVLVAGFMNECAMTISHLIANYSVILSPNIIMPWTPVTCPRPSSFVPNMMLRYTDEMTLFQRFYNSFYFIAIRAINDFHLMPVFEDIAYKYVSKSSSVDTAIDKISLILTNTDPVIITPRPTMPNVVSVGCIHCETALPVPEEFEDFINGSGDEGFILFSLGSNVQSKYLPEEIKQRFIHVFSNLKQRVIWKYEGEIDHLSTNIKATKWMPQQDILGHSKIRLFITHGGLLSLQQAVYHAVPVIGIPLFSDQKVNMARVQQLQIGRTLDFANITVENLNYSINIILQDERYPVNMKKHSRILKDEMDEPAKRAVYWLEYVIRHSGGKHLKSYAERLNWFQYFLIDLLLFLVIGCFLIVTVIRICYKTCCF